ncbi:hypothetical protein BDZ91DRAFT_724563 [Kalaharituber pfeilii]|nr:hypothetical protein BDZ91DRAFT_724563 [Kalaharituber pfeilii]
MAQRCALLSNLNLPAIFPSEALALIFFLHGLGRSYSSFFVSNATKADATPSACLLTANRVYRFRI